MCWGFKAEHTDKNLCHQSAPILVGERKQTSKIQNTSSEMSSVKKFKLRKWIESDGVVMGR